jgi:hypothetical protein
MLLLSLFLVVAGILYLNFPFLRESTPGIIGGSPRDQVVLMNCFELGVPSLIGVSLRLAIHGLARVPSKG